MEFEFKDNRPRVFNLDDRLRKFAEKNGSAAFERLTEEMRAIPKREVKRVTFDIARGASKAYASFELRKKLREQVARDTPNANMRYYDELDAYVAAAVFAFMEEKQTSPRIVVGKEEIAAMCEIRQTFVDDLRPLVRRGALPPGVLAEINKSRKMLKVAYQVLGLVQAIRRNWEAVEKASMIRPDELASAEAKAMLMIESATSRTDRGDEKKQKQELKNRAFTLLCRAYAEVRRTIAYVCWDQPTVLAAFPSLHAEPKKRSRGTKKAEKEADEKKRASSSSALVTAKETSPVLPASNPTSEAPPTNVWTQGWPGSPPIFIGFSPQPVKGLPPSSGSDDG